MSKIEKNVLITGGGGDIAQAIARRLENAGGFVVETPGKDILDVTKISNVRDYYSKFLPDILINNAGYIVPCSVFSGDIENEIKAISINLDGTFICTMLLLEKNSNALIINVGSSAATKVHGTWASYCSAKAAVVMATQCWAEEGAHAICLSPGRTKTKMREALYPDEDPNTLLKPEEYAEIVYQAILGKFENGAHINVNSQNVEDLING